MSQVDQLKVPVEKLYHRADPNMFKFGCTKDLAPLREFIGQDRAIRAMEFGLNMKNGGYNIFMAGITGTGKTSMVKTYIEKLIKERVERGETFELEDWCYLYNFKEPDRPQITNLPQGKGKVFREEISSLLDRVKDNLTKTFASEEYKAQQGKAIEEGRTFQQRLFEQLSAEARAQGFAISMTPMGPILVPMTDGRPMEEKEYLSLPEEQRKALEGKQVELSKKMRSVLEQISRMQKEAQEKLEKGDKDIAEYTVNGLLAPLFQEYNSREKINQFLNGLKTYVMDNLEMFKNKEEPVNPVFGVPMSQVMGGRNPFIPFQVNVFIDNSDKSTPPVIVETNPTFTNIFGKSERRFLFGGYLTDHTMLKPGALSNANHGYLLVSALDVLTNPGVWPALKRAIKNKEVRIEDYEQFGFMVPQAMRPEPMPIDVKIVLIGDSQLYQMLSAYDEDFWEIFKVKADFDTQIPRTPENVMSYAAFLAGCCEECETRHFDPTGVARVIEQSSRTVADQEKLSTRFAQVKELIEEANYWANRDKAELISAQHVQKAIDERIFRHNLVDERIQEFIDRGIIMIDTGGVVVGQINGLSVMTLGDISFGKPSRITARTFLGRSGVVNIEREAQMSGPIHNKGVMILSGYLGWKFAQDKPLSLSASLTFEQSYEGVEGDSASSTELYAILSSLSGVPIKQSFAVTGSVNQKGEVQPIGGINQKIEGFFKACKAKGLTGDQGIVMPETNVKNLMLRSEVVDAVKEGKFHIYAVNTVDEGIEVLTGVAAGQCQADGRYAEGTVNYLVNKQLHEMAEKLREFHAEEKKEVVKEETKAPKPEPPKK